MTFDTDFDTAFDSPTQDTDETTALLIRARGFLERGWCRGNFARDAEGRPTNPTDQHAVMWCPQGALIVSGLPLDKDWPDHPAVERLEDAMGCYSIGRFNAQQETVESVLAAFDRAISQGT